MLCRVHPSVPFVSSLRNGHISSRKDDERKEMAPEGPKKTRPSVLFTWALRGTEEGRKAGRGGQFFGHQCWLCSGQMRHSEPRGFFSQNC